MYIGTIISRKRKKRKVEKNSAFAENHKSFQTPNSNNSTAFCGINIPKVDDDSTPPHSFHGSMLGWSLVSFHRLQKVKNTVNTRN